jgi:hypothetical protein
MATTDDYLALSDSAYNGPGSDDAPAGWTRIAESPTTPGNQGSANGYFGAAFQNDQTGEIVVANRGSRASAEGLKQDWGGSDVQIAKQGSGGVPAAFDDSTNFANSVQADHPGQPISFTGHSLGGAEAQVQAASTGQKAVTFGAPGVAFAVPASQAAAASKNVVNYVLPGDMVGASGTHIGQVVVALPSGGTLIKDALTLAAAAAAATLWGPLAILVAALGLTASNHPLGNYIKALGGGGSAGGSGGGGGVQQVCNGAMMACSFGMAPATLTVLPIKMVNAVSPAANIMDYVPMMNIGTFGMCMSLANPEVAAATAAAMGVLTPMPCIPMTVAPWAPGAPTVMIANQPALDSTSMCNCAYGGLIQITFPGQVTVNVP